MTTAASASTNVNRMQPLTFPPARSGELLNSTKGALQHRSSSSVSLPRFVCACSLSLGYAAGAPAYIKRSPGLAVTNALCVGIVEHTGHVSKYFSFDEKLYRRAPEWYRRTINNHRHTSTHPRTPHTKIRAHIHTHIMFAACAPRERKPRAVFHSFCYFAALESGGRAVEHDCVRVCVTRGVKTNLNWRGRGIKRYVYTANRYLTLSLSHKHTPNRNPSATRRPSQPFQAKRARWSRLSSSSLFSFFLFSHILRPATLSCLLASSSILHPALGGRGNIYLLIGGLVWIFNFRRPEGTCFT